MKHTVLWPETNKQTNKGRKEEGWWVWNNIARLNYYYYYSFYILFCIVFIVIVSFSFSFYFYYFAN